MKKTPSKFINIHFGAISDTFKTQLRKQGFKYDTTVIADYQKQSERVLHLWFGKILTEKQKNMCQEKIFNGIKSHVKKVNP